MCTYLDQVRHTYYFRRAVPAELQPFILTGTGKPRTEWKLSLGTKDRDEAKRLIPAETIASQRLLDAARAELLRGALPPPAPVGHCSPWASEEAFEHWQEGERDQSERDARHEARRPVRRRLRREMEGGSGDIGPEKAAMRDLLRQARRDATEAAERFPLRAIPAAGEGPSAPSEGLTAAIADAPLAAMLDTTIIPLWAAERKVLPKGKDAHAAVVRWFYERVGRKAVAEITRKDVLAFKAKLVSEGTSAANIKVKLSRLRTLLNWAADNDYAETNVADGITIRDTDAAKNKRKEFDLVSLNAIFASPVFVDGFRPVSGKGEAAYWLPLLALHTGARLEELGHLRPGDVMQISYPDATGENRASCFIRLKEDAKGNPHLKNAGSERDVPMHPTLERLGFIDFVQEAVSLGHTRLFPKLMPDKYGRLTAKWGEWFGPYLRIVCGVADKRMVFHSFRHTFKQYARHAGIIEGVQRQIMGHSSGDVADAYGSGYPLHQLVAGMDCYAVPGLAPLG